MGLVDVGLDVGGVGVALEDVVGTSSAGIPTSDPSRASVSTIVEHLALHELAAKQPLLDRVLEPVRLAEVGDAVGIERVDDLVAVEVVGQPLGRGERDDALVQLVDLVDGRAQLRRQVLVVGRPRAARLLGVELEGAPVDLDVALPSKASSARSNRRLPM